MYELSMALRYATGLRQAVKPSEVACKNYRRKLTPEQVVEIKRLLAAGNLTHKEIATKFSVARSTITEIKSGRRWKHLNVIPLTVEIMQNLASISAESVASSRY